MEFHPLKNSSKDSINNKNLKSEISNSSNIECPDSVRNYNGLSGKSMERPYIIDKNNYYLSAEQIEEFDLTGVLIVKSEEIWTPDEMKLLINSVNEMDNWLDSPGKYMKYYESSKLDPNQKILSRIENFTQYNPGLNYFCNGNKLIQTCSQLFGEQSILYKEKINYKLPGGQGFVPHQDVAAGWWMYGQSLHISVLVCIDPATISNGCLEVCYNSHRVGMLSPPWCELSNETASKLDFRPLQTNPGDVIFFDSYVPHKSEPNLTKNSRRVLYATYAKSSEGDYRNQYYQDKRKSFPPDCEREPGTKYEYRV